LHVGVKDLVFGLALGEELTDLPFDLSSNVTVMVRHRLRKTTGRDQLPFELFGRCFLSQREDSLLDSGSLSFIGEGETSREYGHKS
jgi:hypothetical protein